MIKIRNSVFETNSSSTHCLSVSGRNSNKSLDINPLAKHIEEDNYLHISFMEFGWGPDHYTSSYSKLVYLVQMICDTHGIHSWCNNETNNSVMKELEDIDEWEWINNKIRDWFDVVGIYIDSVDGYIDHQSYEVYGSAREFLDDYCVSLNDFLFNSNVMLIIDNDN